jgi:hypothetical protein
LKVRRKQVYFVKILLNYFSETSSSMADNEMPIAMGEAVESIVSALQRFSRDHPITEEQLEEVVRRFGLVVAAGKNK